MTGLRTVPDSYFKLVKQFPLTHIRDADHLCSAQELIDKLLEKNLDAGQEEYLNALTDLVEIYEDVHEPMPDASEGDVLRELMRSNRLSQRALAKKIGISQPTIAAVLNGTRTLTKAQVIILAKFFNVSGATFLPA